LAFVLVLASEGEKEDGEAFVWDPIIDLQSREEVAEEEGVSFPTFERQTERKEEI